MQRYEIINWLIKKYDYKIYLEIGVAQGDCFEKIECKIKHCVDPAEDAVGYAFHCTSDEYFSTLPKAVNYDIIFIDGLHLHQQVERDIHNSLKHLAEGGTIVVHDCNPPTANYAQIEPRIYSRNGLGEEHVLWNGTTWRAWVMTRILHPELEMCVVDTDWGCGIIQRHPEGFLSEPHVWACFSEDQNRQHITYETMADDRVNVLGLISTKEFRDMFSVEADLS